MKQQAEVIIPLYKYEYSSFEENVLINNLEILKNFPFTIICSESFEIDNIGFLKKYKDIKVERFDDSFFSSIDGYNSLMLSSLFYEKFLHNEYILICQTDAFVFHDELSFWCRKGYDYIGAPWIGSSPNLINSFFSSVNNLFRKWKGKMPKNTERLFKVGNGGFSLRKVESFYTLSKKYSELIADYSKCKGSSIYYTEDVFWSLRIPQLEPSFSIPDYKMAVGFSIDRKPRIAMQINNNKLPFGCHGFDKPKVRKFWNPIIKKHIENLSSNG